jgi:hypothetical protein
VIWWYISGLLTFPPLLCGYLLSLAGWSADVVRAIANRSQKARHADYRLMPWSHAERSVRPAAREQNRFLTW